MNHIKPCDTLQKTEKTTIYVTSYIWCNIWIWWDASTHYITFTYIWRFNVKISGMPLWLLPVYGSQALKKYILLFIGAALSKISYWRYVGSLSLQLYQLLDGGTATSANSAALCHGTVVIHEQLDLISMLVDLYLWKLTEVLAEFTAKHFFLPPLKYKICFCETLYSWLASNGLPITYVY